MPACENCPRSFNTPAGVKVHQRTCKPKPAPPALVAEAAPPNNVATIIENMPEQPGQQATAPYSQEELAEFVQACEGHASQPKPTAPPTPAPSAAAAEAIAPPAISAILRLAKDYKAKTAAAKHIERFDADILNHILINKDKFGALLRADKVGIDKADPFVLASKYLAKSKASQGQGFRMVSVDYRQNNSHGRFFAVGQLSLQILTRQIRHSIAGKFYKDIDIKNAHPVFLLHFCDKLGLSAPYLQTYVRHRARALESVYPGDPGRSKQVILAMLNAGTADFKAVPKKTEWLLGLKRELAGIHAVIAKGPDFDRHAEWDKKRKAKAEGSGAINCRYENTAGSYINTLFCQFENRILQTIWQALGSPSECVLCFDGIMVPHALPVDIPAIEAEVLAKHGISIELAEKPMEEGFDLAGEVIEPYAPPEAAPRDYYFSDYGLFAPDDDALEQVSHSLADVRKYLRDTVIYIDNGAKSYVLTKNREYEEGFAREYVVYKPVKESDPPYSAPHKVCHFDVSLTDGTKKPMADLYKQNCLTNRYDAAQFIPYLIENPNISKKVFNTFGGYRFPYEPIPHGQPPASIARILAHKRDIICSGNAYAYEYYCRWIAHIIQKPAQMMPISMFIKTKEQGTGKTRETSQLATMLGEAYTIEINRLENVAGKFNSIMLDKLLIVGNDVADKGGFDVAAVNSLISEKKKTIEFKGIDPRQANIYARIILTSNYDCALLFTEENRRWVALNPLTTMKGNTAYWDALSADIDDPAVQRDAFLYFANYPIDSPWVDAAGVAHPWNWQTLPKTERTNAVREANLNPLLAFLKAGVDGDVPELRFTDLHIAGDDEKEREPTLIEKTIGNSAFYEVYVKWHKDNAYKAVKKGQDITREMGEFGFPKKVVRVGIERERVNGYSLCPRKILALYAKAMGESVAAVA